MPEQSNSRSQAGKVLGSASTESKARAARQNGKAGGRPVGSVNHSSNRSKKDEKK
jgi:hypothetical protein